MQYLSNRLTKILFITMLLITITSYSAIPNVLDPLGLGIGTSFDPLQLNPVAWFRADGNALDSVGGFNGTWTGTPTYTNGLVNQAFSFAPSRLISCGNQFVYNEMTITCWIRSRGPWKPDINGNYICSKLSNGTTVSYLFRVHNNQKLNLIFSTNLGDITINSSNTLEQSSWVFVGFSIKSRDSRVYVNGQTMGIAEGEFSTISVTTDNFNIASRGSSLGYSSTMDIDNVMIFNRARRHKKLYSFTTGDNI